jgi:hypothetical protein
MTKGVRNIRLPFWCGVDNDRDKERHPLGQVVRAIDGEFPLAPEITLGPRFRACRDNRHEQPALTDLLANAAVPRVPTPKLALVEPDLDASGAERPANPLSRLGIL